MEITPGLADAWLKKNPGNRPIRKAVVKSFALDMLAGNWKLTHQGVAFDAAGNLIDGQHRLTAVIMAGVPVRMMVTTGLPGREEGHATSTMDVIDRGAPRSIGNQLKIQHGFAEPHTIAALCTTLGNLCAPEKTRRMTVSQVLAIHAAYADPIKWILPLRSKAVGLRGIGVLAGFVFALGATWNSPTDQEIKKMFAAFNRGDETNPGDPIQLLRVFCLSDEAALFTRSMNRGLAELVLQAINLQLAGKPIAKLELSQDGYNHFKELQADRVKSIHKLFALPTAVLIYEPPKTPKPKPAVSAASVTPVPFRVSPAEPPPPAKPTVTAIITAAEKHFGLGEALLVKKKVADSEALFARRSIMRAAETLGLSKRDIAHAFAWEVNEVTRDMAIFADQIKFDPRMNAKHQKFTKSLSPSA